MKLEHAQSDLRFDLLETGPGPGPRTQLLYTCTPDAISGLGRRRDPGPREVAGMRDVATIREYCKVGLTLEHVLEPLNPGVNIPEAGAQCIFTVSNRTAQLELLGLGSCEQLLLRCEK